MLSSACKAERMSTKLMSHALGCTVDASRYVRKLSKVKRRLCNRIALRSIVTRQWKTQPLSIVIAI